MKKNQIFNITHMQKKTSREQVGSGFSLPLLKVLVEESEEDERVYAEGGVCGWMQEDILVYMYMYILHH